jgi:hypothetical protein
MVPHSGIMLYRITTHYIERIWLNIIIPIYSYLAPYDIKSGNCEKISG